jgi:hypothetical protein
MVVIGSLSMLNEGDMMYQEKLADGIVLLVREDVYRESE